VRQNLDGGGILERLCEKSHHRTVQRPRAFESGSLSLIKKNSWP